MSPAAKTKRRQRGKRGARPVDQKLIRALGHPVRQRILQALGGEVASPNELAQQLDEPLGNVSYHVKILAECDAVELVRTQPVRGAVEHFYRASARARIDDAEHWARLPESVRRALFDQTLQQTWQHLAEAAEQGGFDNPNTHLGWTTLELDDEAYEELGSEMIALLDRALEMQAESLVRLADLPEEERASHRLELAMQLFHRDPKKSSSGGAHRRRGKRRRGVAGRKA
jgi:DNA-binding transcriptional ArsR family regulator